MDKAPKILKPLHRELTIGRDAINADMRTVTLAFSSEAPVERYFGTEILDHNPRSVRLGRITDGGPLLMNHDPECQIGVVESVEIGPDRVGRAIVRFGKGEEADEIFNDVVDGIRRKVSVGYQVHSMVLESRDGGAEIYRVNDWEPLEISIVSIPADNSVGVGRSLDENSIPKEKIMTEQTPAVAPAAAAAPSVDVAAIESQARSKELARVRELTAIGDSFAQFGGVELARQYVAEVKSVDALNAAILERAGKKPVATAEIGMTDKEVREFSFVRALHALANPTDRKAQEAAKFEIECSRAAAEKAGKAPQGLLVPYDVLAAGSKRALAAGTGSTGGYAVATDLLAGSFIELLRNRLVVSALGATTLNGLTGNIAIPRQAGAATAYWVAEAGSPTASNQTLDQVTMSPKTVGAYTDYSRKLLLQSSIDVENMVRMDLAKIIALEIDRVALYGKGSSGEPTGIKNTAGTRVVDFAAATPTFAEIVSLETQVAAQNADIGTLAYAINATMRGSLKTKEKGSAGYPIYVYENDMMNGYRTEVSNQIASGDVFFGNWSELMVGFWSGLDLMVDPYSNSTSGTVRLVALQDVDVAVRHPVSFARGNDSL